MSWCRAHGGHVMPISALGCGYEIARTGNWNYCNTDSTPDTIGSGGKAARSWQMQALMTEFKDGYHWLAEDYGDNCYAYFTLLSQGQGGISSYGSRSSNDNVFALCQ